VRVPGNAGSGKAKVTLSYPKWKGPAVDSTTVEVPIKESPPRPAKQSNVAIPVASRRRRGRTSATPAVSCALVVRVVREQHQCSVYFGRVPSRQRRLHGCCGQSSAAAACGRYEPKKNFPGALTKAEGGGIR
jgi:hypothetical protein